MKKGKAIRMRCVVIWVECVSPGVGMNAANGGRWTDKDPAAAGVTKILHAVFNGGAAVGILGYVRPR